MLFGNVVDHRVDVTDTMHQDAFIASINVGKIRREATKCLEIIIQWKYGSTTLGIIEYVKECYPFQLAQYYHHIQIYQ